ncbi:MAG TPA: deoxyribonuclease V [Acidobacteriota bacterium]
MRIARPTHRWSLTPKQAVALQRRLAARVIARGDARALRRIAGCDLAFSSDGRFCIAAAVLWDLGSQVVIEQRVAWRPLRFPYVPGLLSFREAPAVLAALRRLRSAPDAVMCDGHGTAHPRRFGLACHIGMLCGLPTIGCAKSLLIGSHRAPARRRGSRAALLDRGARVGTVLRTQDGVRPVFVSVGHRIDLRAAEQVVLQSATRFRLPEPTRLADRLVAAIKHSHSPLG